MTQCISRTLFPLFALLLATIVAGDARASELPRFDDNYAATYRVHVTNESGERGHGTGFVIHQDGILLTNHHVVEGAENIRIHVRGPNNEVVVLHAEVLASDPHDDIAIIKIAHRFNESVALEDPALIKSGLPIYSIGFPMTLMKNVDLGYIRQSELAPDPEDPDRAIIDRLYMHISNGHGTSGSAILSQRTGRAVGMMRSFFTRSIGPHDPMKIVVAVPITRIRAFLNAHGIPYNAFDAQRNAVIPHNRGPRGEASK